jgi:hypothetical protein
MTDTPKKKGMMRALGDLLTRAGIAGRLGKTFDGERDLYNSFGYRRDPEFDDYLSYYLRGDIAARVVDLYPKATWRHAPEIRSEDEQFVEAVAELDDRLRLFHFMERVDEISGIGQFGVMLLGTRGAPITDEPGKLSGPEDLVYLAAYHQGSVDIDSFVTDSEDPRFGLPNNYQIDLTGSTLAFGEKSRQSNQTSRVPWERVIHVAEATVEDDVYGQPRLARVLNRIDDLFKVLGGSAELYWQNVAGIWHADISPDVTVTEEDLDTFEDDMLAARQGITKLVQTRGTDLNLVTGTGTDPSGTYNALVQIISAAAGIPERVLFGSERGQLAGDQDQREWQARVASRQEQFAEPNILRQTLDRFISLGALKAPSAPYEVEWPPLDSPSTADRADLASKFGAAIAALAPAGAPDLIMPPWEVREKILGLDPIPPQVPDGFEFASGFEEVPPVVVPPNLRAEG